MIFNAMADAFHVVCGRIVFEGGETRPQPIGLASGSEDWLVVVADGCAVLVKVCSASGVAKFSNRDKRVLNLGKNMSRGCFGWKRLQGRKGESGCVG